jgi:hypothetical protein
MRLLLTLLFLILTGKYAFACEAGTSAEFYECREKANVEKANTVLEEQMNSCTQDCCIKKSATKIAKKMNCKVRFLVK